MPPKRKKGVDDKPLFTKAKMKSIMQEDEEVGKIAALVPILVSKCVELFARDLVHKACQTASEYDQKTLEPPHLKAAVTETKAFEFLKEKVEYVGDISQLKGKKKPKRRRDTGLDTGLPPVLLQESAAASVPKKESKAKAADSEDDDDHPITKKPKKIVQTQKKSKKEVEKPRIEKPRRDAAGPGTGVAPKTEMFPVATSSIVSGFGCAMDDDEEDYDI